MHLILLFVLWKKERVKEFPIFTALVVINIVNAVILNLIFHNGSRDAYRLTYFGFAVVDLALQLLIVYELASHVFAPTGRWARDIRKGFVVVALISILVAGTLALLPAPPEKTLLKAILDRGNVFSSALLCELFLGMLTFSVTARLPWKTHVARIAQGLGFYSLVGILTESGHSVIGYSYVLTFVRMTAYLGCVVYWIITLWQRAPVPRELPDEMRQQLFTLQRLVTYDLRKLRTIKR